MATITAAEDIGAPSKVGTPPPSYTLNRAGKTLKTSNHTVKAWLQALCQIYGDRAYLLVSRNPSGKVASVSQQGLDELRRIKEQRDSDIPLAQILEAIRNELEPPTSNTDFQTTSNPVDGELVLLEDDFEYIQGELEEENDQQIDGLGDLFEALEENFVGLARRRARQIKNRAAKEFVEELGSIGDTLNKVATTPKQTR